jgi:hypothetical protein
MSNVFKDANLNNEIKVITSEGFTLSVEAKHNHTGRKDYEEKFGERRKQLVQLFNEGKKASEIAELLGMHPANVTRYLKRAGLKTPDRSEAQRRIHINYFEDYNNREVSYWIGMLATDGWIDEQRQRIQLSLKDKEHIEKFNKFLGGVMSVNSTENQWRLVFSQPDTCKSLVSYGVTGCKSLTLKLTIPITWDMLRGIIDGDGCWSRINTYGVCCSIATCSYEFGKQIYMFFKSNDITPVVSKQVKDRLNPLYDIRINKKEDIAKLITNLYKDAPIYLDRKVIKIMQLIDNPSFKSESAAQ